MILKKFFKRAAAALVAAAVAFTCVCTGSESEKVSALKYADTSEYEQLDELYKDYFKFGCACEAIDHWGNSKSEIGNPNKEEVLSTIFNSITCGNEMKPAYNFSSTSETLYSPDHAAVEMMQWCKDNGVGLRGHNLVWHGQINPSIFGKDFKVYSNGVLTTSDSATLDEDCLVDRETLLERLKTFIYGTMEYIYSEGYADVIYAWDVVNEAADEGYEDGLRRSYWYKIIGQDYLYYCFLYAREATLTCASEYASLYGLDPEGDLSPIIPKLYYNDYNEWFENRGDKIVKFLTQDKWNENHEKVQSFAINPDGDGTIYGDGLIDGIGMQGHLSDTNNIDQYMKALRKYSDAVDEVQITELDVGATRTGINKWYYQAKFYYEFFSRLIEEVKNGAKLNSVTVWGLTDDNSWREDADPLLFNADLSKKACFDAIVMAAKGEEFTLTAAQTNTDHSDTVIDFEPYSSGGTNTVVVPAEVGVLARGTGHQSSLTLKMKTNHTPDAKLGFSLEVSRAEKDASIKIDASKFVGCKLKFTAFVKAEDSNILVGLDSSTPQLLKTVPNTEEWNEVTLYLDVPSSDSAFFYIETDGSATYYVDDIFMTVVDEIPVEETVATENASSDAASSDDVQSDDAAVLDSSVNDAPAASTDTKADGDASAASTGAEDIDTSNTKIYIALAIEAVLAVAAIVIFVTVKKKKKN